MEISNIVTCAPATQAHVDAMLGSLREDDERECWASVRMTADAALQHSYDSSQLKWTGLLGRHPVIMFGVGAPAVLSLIGSPWLLGTDHTRLLGSRILRDSKMYIEQMQSRYTVLANFVDARNLISIRWLKWCGFTIEEARPFGPDGLPFHPFWMKQEVV